MTKAILFWLLVACMGAAGAAAPVSVFGSQTKGGKGGRVLMVTRLDDNPKRPTKGSLRWALQQRGPRIVRFTVSGDITLQDEIIISEPFLTLDGSEAPESGVTIRSGNLIFKHTHDIIVRQVRIRLGDAPARRQRREQRRDRPMHSEGLDCVSLEDSQRIVFDHCSLSWSCDEIFGILRCSDVTIQWCILSEPLCGPSLHPYGDTHACPLNASASTLSIHHCLFANFVMRGPQFECNDVSSKSRTAVQMEAVNNVIAGYEHSGSRFSVGVEKNNGSTAGKSFRFQFINNLYVADSRSQPAIEAITKHGVTLNILIHASGNFLSYSRWRALASVRPPFWTHEDDHLGLDSLLSEHLLFTTPASSKPDSAEVAAARVLAEAGCSIYRDAMDQRVIDDVQNRRFSKVVTP